PWYDGSSRKTRDLGPAPSSIHETKAGRCTCRKPSEERGRCAQPPRHRAATPKTRSGVRKLSNILGCRATLATACTRRIFTGPLGDFRTMRRILLTSLAVAPLLAGCESLQARLTAQQGVDLYHRQDYAGAAAKFAEARKHDPRIAAIPLNLGLANLSLYRMAPNSTHAAKAATTAIVAFQDYLKLKPKDDRAKVLLVQTFVDTGKYDEAV